MQSLGFIGSIGTGLTALFNFKDLIQSVSKKTMLENEVNKLYNELKEYDTEESKGIKK